MTDELSSPIFGQGLEVLLPEPIFFFNAKRQGPHNAKTKHYVHAKPSINIIVALLTIAPKWKQSKCP